MNAPRRERPESVADSAAESNPGGTRGLANHFLGPKHDPLTGEPISGVRRITDAAMSMLLLVAAGFFVAGAAITIADVLARALFSSNVDAAIELTTLFVGLGALLSMPMCFARLEHVTAKMISEFLSGRRGAILNIFGALLSVVFVAALFLFTAQSAWEKFGSPQTTPDIGLRVSWLWIIVAGSIGLSVLASIRGLMTALGRSAPNG